MDRRQFLRQGLGLSLAATAGGILLPAGFVSEAQAREPHFDISTGSRYLDLYRPATKGRERLRLEYLRDGQWVSGAYQQICWLLRDTHVNQYVQMDTRLIAIMDWTQSFLRAYGYAATLHIYSGYRTKYTNDHTEGAAKNSQHLYGRAVDIHIPGIPTEYLGRLYRWLAQGGVGVYAGDEFVHVDTGPVRSWRG